MSLEDKLAALRRSYASRLGDKIAALEEALAAIRVEPTADAVEHAWHLAHRMKGTGTSYGFPELTAACGEVEAALTPAREGGAVSAEGWSAIELGLERARKLIPTDTEPR